MDSVHRTAFILQIHKNPDQVNRFIRQLTAEEQADVFIHIDKRSYENMSGKILKNSNVNVLDESIVCEWGDIRQIDATIMLLRQVIASKNQYDFVCLRSGQDLLVKEGFKEFLLENKGKIFMKMRNTTKKKLAFMKVKWPKAARRRYTSAHPIRIFRRFLLSLYGMGINMFPNTNKWPADYSFHTGSQWFTIPFEVAKYMIEFLDHNEWYYQFFEHSLVPDEWFFHTLIMNSPYKDMVVSNNLMFFKWGETLSERNSPQDLTLGDLHLIENSNCFFARKFDEKVDNSIIEYFTNNVRFGSKQEISAYQNNQIIGENYGILSNY